MTLTENVSILVLLDRDKEPTINDAFRWLLFEFQSLFYWIEIKNWNDRFRQRNSINVSILVLLDRDKEHY